MAATQISMGRRGIVDSFLLKSSQDSLRLEEVQQNGAY